MRGKPAIIGLASYLPFLVSDSPRGDRTVEAVGVLIRLARYLRALDERHTCEYLEIIAGRSFEMTGSYREPDGPEISWLSVDDCFVRLKRNLGRLKVLAEGKRGKDSVALSLEIEPGLVPLVNDAFSLQSLVRDVLIPLDSAAIGVNIDIGHMMIIRDILPQFVFDDQQIARQVVHAHISDNAQSHFADLPCGMFHERARFQQWVKGLATLRADGEDTKYCGTLALELEACQDAGRAAAAYRDIVDLCHEALP